MTQFSFAIIGAVMIRFKTINDFDNFKKNCPYCSEPLGLRLWKSFSKECSSFIEGNFLCVTAGSTVIPVVGGTPQVIDCIFKIDMLTNKIISELSNEILFSCFSGAKFKLTKMCSNHCKMLNGNSYGYTSYPLTIDVKSMKVFETLLGTIIVTAKMKDSKSSVQYISDYIKSKTNVAVFKYLPVARCQVLTNSYLGPLAHYNYSSVDYNLKKTYIFNKWVDLITEDKLDNVDTLISRAKTYVLFE